MKMNKLLIPLLLTIFFLMFTNSCVDPSLVPVVQTKSFTAITANTATCWGNVPSDPGSEITERGVCWNTKSNPTIKNSKATTTAGTGNFSVAMTGLTMETTYYVRCYATNKSGTAYGNELTLTTLIEDYNGNIYHKVKIGNQVWMVENLKVTTYRNGNTITNVTDPTTWSSLTSGAYCSYSNSTTNKSTYGYLYNWAVVSDSRNIAPTGWHVPTKAEWTTLITYLGTASIVGDLLKETGNTHWTGTYTGATNTSGFTALPGGYIALKNNVYGFYGIGTDGQWWSDTEVDTNNAWKISLTNNSGQAVTENGVKQNGLSIRCIKD
jgi:uncharacterized protein (TIGR02145 family)